MACIADDFAGPLILRAIKERAQARIDLRKTQTLIGELGRAYSILGTALLALVDNTEPVEFSLESKIGAELIPLMNPDKLMALIGETQALLRKVADCTGVLSGYLGE